MDIGLMAIGLVLIVMAVDDYFQYRETKETRRLGWAMISLFLGVLNIYANWYQDKSMKKVQAKFMAEDGTEICQWDFTLDSFINAKQQDREWIWDELLSQFTAYLDQVNQNTMKETEKNQACKVDNKWFFAYNRGLDSR